MVATPTEVRRVLKSSKITTVRVGLGIRAHLLVSTLKLIIRLSNSNLIVITNNQDPPLQSRQISIKLQQQRSLEQTCLKNSSLVVS